jgi:outer membrane protein
VKLSGVLMLTVLALFVGRAVGQPPQGLGLALAVDAALENHPTAKAARLGIEQARNHSAEARAQRAPKISVSETVTRGNNPVFVFGSLLEQAQFGPANFDLPTLNNPPSLTNFRTVVSADLSIFDGMKTSARVAQSKIGNDVALLQNQAAEQQVRFEVLRNYFGLVLAETALDVAEDALRTADADVARARDRVDAGLTVESDLLAAQVQLAEFKQQRIQAEGQRATALAVLNVAMGAGSNTPRALTLRLLQKTFDVVGPDELVSRALLHRPDYRQSESGIEIADRRISEQRSAYLPDLNAFASVGSSHRNFSTGSADYTIGAALKFTLLDRSRPAKVAQAQVDKRLAETERDRLSDALRVEVVSAYYRYRAAEQQVDVADAALSQAVEGLRIVQNRYEAGLTTVTEMLRAETAVVRARMNVAVSRHGQYLGYATVLLSIGELNDVRAFEP